MTSDISTFARDFFVRLRSFIIGTGAVFALLNGPFTLAEEPLRIISVDANATELLIAADLADRLIAIDMTSQNLLPSRHLPDLGYHRNLSAEAIIGLHPDLLIGSDHFGPPATRAILEKTDIALLTLPVPLTIAQLRQNIETLAEHLNRPTVFADLLNTLNRYEATLQTAQQQHPAARMAFLLQLNERGLSQAGQGTTGDALITLMNGQNISQYSNYRPISTEALLNEDPAVILLASDQPPEQAIAALLAQFPLFAHGQAYQQQRIFVIDPSALIAGLSVSAVKLAAEIAPSIHP